jgi:hypothetical protein
MKRLVASLWMCFGAYCGYQSNTAPLAFGMTPEEVSRVVGAPLIHYARWNGSDVYVVYGTPAIPGFYPSHSALALQFRKGHLTGWKKDWSMQRPWW